MRMDAHTDRGSLNIFLVRELSQNGNYLMRFILRDKGVDVGVLVGGCSLPKG